MATDSNTGDTSTQNNTGQNNTGQSNNGDESVIDTALESAKSFLETAQEAIGDAVDATVGAVKEHPVAAAAIAAGAAAAVGGAVYAATQLGGTEKSSPKGGKKN